jgi:CheY-like chemotaxis protein
MFRIAGPASCIGALLAVLLVAGSPPAPAQTSTDGFITGEAARAWQHWSAAMQAILARNEEQAEAAFGELLALDPSPFRIALLADYTVQQTAAGGAVLLFEQDFESKALGPQGQAVAEKLFVGREQVNQADDALYFSQIGRFDVAGANLRALLAADPDPVALLEFIDRVPRRRDILIQLVDNPSLGEPVRALLKLLDLGELAIKADPTRIKENIERLGGPPRGYENALAALQDSSEYAVPFLLQYLRDPTKQALTQAILRTLPQLDRRAVNPLVMALRMDDQAVKRYVIEALGKLGYAQAIPYLLWLVEDQQTPPELQQRAQQSLDLLRARGVTIPADLSAAEAFHQLADEYYADRASLAADPRLSTANVWYWRDGMLQNIEVPTEIFNEIMAMRSAEEALLRDPQARPALALWLAANFRREAQLAANQQDPTRPPDYPIAAYFAQSAGADYNLAALARAIDTADPAVALGTIDALRKTAGPASLVADAGGRLPLAEALSFPDRMVRIRAALTLGGGRPTEPFNNYQNLLPVLSEALLLHGGARNALVVDPDQASANTVGGILREQGYTVTVGAALFDALQQVREQIPALDVIFLASDMQNPTLETALQTLHDEFRFAAVPVVIVTKPGDLEAVRALVRADHRVAALPLNPTPSDLSKAIATVSRAVGSQAITPEVGQQLAFEAAQVLRLLAISNNPLFSVADAEPALLAALTTTNPDLRLLVAEVLGYLGSTRAQEAIARVALDPAAADDLRVSMFAALAEAAKRRGNLLPSDLVQAVVAIAASEPNMILREAASQALGALNVPGEPASEIIRSQYQG